MPNANYNYPTSVRFGPGRAGELAAMCAELGIEKPLLVTDPGLAAMPMIADIVGQLAAEGLGVKVFADIRPNPVGENIEKGAEVFRSGKMDGVIAIGGGSALDAGKVIAMMAGQERPLWDFEDVGDNWTRAKAEAIAPIIAVPTTAGTGSEVGRAGVITNAETHEKKIIFHPKLMPSIAVLDPELTVGLPAGLTAATGMDALSHNLEAYCAPGFHPMADGIAVEGIRLVKENLETAVKEPENIEARGKMLMASAMGATAFQKGLGGMHALAHPLGGVYDAHHGMLNAILMPYVLKANRPAIEERFERLAAWLGLEDGFEGVLEWVLELRKAIGIPNSLAEIGIGDERLEDIAAMAVKDPSAGGNPIPFGEKEYLEIVTNAQKGDLQA